MFERNRIAETLRSAREKQGLSLEQAAAAAGIPMQYLRLLEGETNVRVGVSDELYLIPFFRKYAHFFGIDAEEMLPEFLGLVQQVPGEGSPPIRLAYRPRWAFLWKPAAVVLTIAVAVLLILYRTPERPTFDDSSSADSNSLVPTESPSIVSSPPVARATTQMPVAVDGSSAQGPTGSATPSEPAPTPTVVPAGAHELTIHAINEAWLSLALDGQPAKQFLLRPGESRSWSAEHFSLTVGNAGGVTLSLDGQELPAIGRPGQVVRNLRIPAGALPSPSPSPT